MTLHISAFVPPGVAIQVSDRLASRGGQPWDPTWNKTVVLRTMDALVAIGLTGPAYVGTRPVDEWLTEVLFGEEVTRGAIGIMRVGGHNPNRLSASLAAAEAAYTSAAAEGAFGLAVPPGAAVIGWRDRSGDVEPCAFALEWDGARADFRRRTRSRHRAGGLGVNPAAWVPVDRRQRLWEDIKTAPSHGAREDRMIRVLREAHEAGHPIGPDAMCIRIPRNRPVPHIRFAPVELPSGTFTDDESGDRYRAPAIYTPAIVTPTVAQPPLVATGPPFEKLDTFEIEWELPNLPPPRVGDGGRLLWRIEGQPRPPAPPSAGAAQEAS
jgi:hypothetical protein